MAIISRRVSSDGEAPRERDVTLSASDAFGTNRDKLARIIVDAMYQFVGLLDVHGNMLEINRAALDAVGIRMDDICGKPFWEARWWVISAETQGLLRELILRASQGEFVRCDFEFTVKQWARKQSLLIFHYCPLKIRLATSYFCFRKAVISLKRSGPRKR